MANRVKVRINWLDAELFSDEGDNVAPMLEPVHGILVPGGFGERGREGKIASVRFARARNVPFFGICLGMQMACLAAAPPVGLDKANTPHSGSHTRKDVE